MSVHLDAVTPIDLARQDQLQAPDTPVEQESVRIDGNATNSGQQEVRHTTTGNPIVALTLHQSGDVSVVREVMFVEVADEFGRPQMQVETDHLVFNTGDGDDRIEVLQNPNGSLDVGINGQVFETTLSPIQEVAIRAHGGDDVIRVDSGVRVNFIIDGGEGNDTIEALGSGNDRISGNGGDDVITVGRGNNYVYGGAGDDAITVLGAGSNVLYGGQGNDTISGGQGGDYIDGGAGNDRIDGVAGQNILVGSLGSNVIHSGTGDSRVYAGEDTSVLNGGGSDVVYAPEAIANRIDAVDGASNTVVNVVLDRTLGQSLEIQGSEEFVSRVQADIEMLRNSPYGQQMLAEFDAARAANGGNAKVTIIELQNENNGYAMMDFQNGAPYITGGQAGPSSNVTIAYNPGFFVESLPAPSVILYHEMSHAFNSVTGTFMNGQYDGGDLGRRHPDYGLVLPERQAVGLPTNHAPFDFGNGRVETTNPFPLTENGIREEMGLELRPTYLGV